MSIKEQKALKTNIYIYISTWGKGRMIFTCLLKKKE